MKKVILSLFILFFTVAIFAQKSNYQSIQFVDDSVELKSTSTATFEKWINDNYTEKHEQEINIHCLYTGNEKSAIYQLQRERGIIIAQLLEELEIEEQKIIFISDKDELPDYMKGISTQEILVEIKTIHKKIKNKILAHSKPILKNKIEKKTAYPDQKTILFLENGSIIDVPENAFETVDGIAYNGRIILEVTEILDIKSSFANNISTMSDEGILESKGMIDIKAESVDGDELQLRKGKALGINLPLKSTDIEDVEGFKIYDAVEKEMDGEKLIEWKSTTQKPNISKRSTKAYEEFIWTKISSQKKKEIKEERELLIAEMKEKQSKSYIKRRIKLYKERYKHKHQRYKKRKNYKIKKTWSGRDYTKVRKRTFLGNPKYHWERYERKNYKVKEKKSFFSFRMLALGLVNIDRPIKYKFEKIEDEILVNADPKSKVTIVFKDSFSMIYAKRKKREFTFKNIPEGQEVVIFSSLDNGKGSVFFSRLDITLASGNIKLPESKIISKKEFSSFLASVQNK